MAALTYRVPGAEELPGFIANQSTGTIQIAPSDIAYSFYTGDASDHIYDASLYLNTATGSVTTSSGDFAINGINITSSTATISYNYPNYIYYGTNVSDFHAYSQDNKKWLIQNQIKTNLLFKSSRKRSVIDWSNTSPQEIKARETLRDMLSESDWRRYVTNGFIMAKGDSGLWYQIFADGRNPIVYEKGKKIQSICIHTDKSCPPTDHVINMKVLVELDEMAVWQGGNLRLIDDHSNFNLVCTNEKPVQNLIEFSKRIVRQQHVICTQTASVAS